MNEGHYVVFAWGLDLCQAVNERNRFFKWLIKVGLGKHALNEYLGMRTAIDDMGCDTNMDYELQEMEYHDKFKNVRL